MELVLCRSNVSARCGGPEGYAEGYFGKIHSFSSVGGDNIIEEKDIEELFSFEKAQTRRSLRFLPLKSTKEGLKVTESSGSGVFLIDVHDVGRMGRIRRDFFMYLTPFVHVFSLKSSRVSKTD